MCQLVAATRGGKGLGEEEEEEGVDEGGGGDEEKGVDAVEDAAVTGDEVARVLDVQCALDQRFHEVSPRAEDGHYRRHPEPKAYISLVWEKRAAVVAEKERRSEIEEESSEESLPALLRTDALEELMASHHRTDQKGPSIVDPDHEESDKQ